MEYSHGSIVKAKVAHRGPDGRRGARWEWRGVITVTRDDGTRTHRSRNLGIECSPPRAGEVRGTGKGSDSALRALAEWRQALMERDEAEAARASALEAARRAEQAERARRRLGTWECVDAYIAASYKGGFIEASTERDYHKTASMLRATLPDGPVDDLTPAALDEWQARLSERYAHTTVKKVRNLLRAAVQWAMDTGRAKFRNNPVRARRATLAERRDARATAPKLNALDRRNRSILLAELDTMADTPVTIAGRIGLYAGLREAEVCALMWADVDLRAGFIVVDKALGHGEGGTYMKPQKGGADERDVPINPELGEALRRWRSEQAEVALALGVPLAQTFVIGNPAVVPPPECFEWRTARGAGRGMGNSGAYPAGAMPPDVLSKGWRVLSQASKARGMLGRPATFHNLRHTFGMYAANEAGIPIEQLAEWMGHSSTQTTRRYYVARDREAARRRSTEAMSRIVEAGAVRSAPAEVLPLGRTGTEG